MQLTCLQVEIAYRLLMEEFTEIRELDSFCIWPIPCLEPMFLAEMAKSFRLIAFGKQIGGLKWSTFGCEVTLNVNN